MEAFPDFMKASLNHIDSSQQNTPDIDGYYYEGKDGSQICVWTYLADRESKENVHEFDEYVLCVEGDPKGVPHHGRVTKGTRTIHAFGGKRITS